MSARMSDEGEEDFEERLAAEEDLEGMGGERGLEETLERLGFGMSIKCAGADDRRIPLETSCTLSDLPECVATDVSGALWFWLDVR